MRPIEILERLRKPTIAVVAGAVTAVVFASAAYAGIAIKVKVTSPSPSTPPAVATAFPSPGGSVGAAAWAKGCKTVGICGTASDKDGVRSVLVAVQRASGEYWNGVSFSVAAPTWFAAKGTTSWGLALKLPPDGSYRALVRATDKKGYSTPLDAPVASSFAVDSKPPEAPTIVDGPGSLTLSTDAAFRFLTLDASVTFRCGMDKNPLQRCDPSTRFLKLAIGDHCLTVVAVDGALNVSAQVKLCFTIVTKAFGVTAVISQPLMPGDSVPVNLQVTNPYSFKLRVDAVDITVQDATKVAGRAAPGCVGSTNFATTSFGGPVTIPAGQTRTLEQLGVPQSRWPTLQMHNLPVNQDACQGAQLSLTYTGTGTKTL